MSALTRTTANAVTRELCRRYAMLVTYKAGPLWGAVGMVFDAARLAGARVPSGREFVEQYAQALPLIPGAGSPASVLLALPEAPMEPDAEAELFVHEATHGVQYRADARWPVLYVQHPEYRALSAEAPAYAAGLALRWVLTGRVPTQADIDGVVHVLHEGYGAGDHAVVAGDLLAARITELAHGVIRSEAARVAIAIIYREQPDALHPDALALLRAHCPEALVLA